MVIKLVTQLGQRMDEQWEYQQKERKYKKVPNRNNRAQEYELKNTLVGFNSRLDELDERITNLEDRAVELIQTDQQKERGILKSEDNLRDLSDNIE